MGQTTRQMPLVGDLIALVRRLRLRRPDVPPENLREGGAVRNVEEAERADLPMQLDRVDMGAEQLRGDTALIKHLDRVDRRDVEIADRRRALQILAVMDVLDHHHADEVLVAVMVVDSPGLI